MTIAQERVAVSRPSPLVVKFGGELIEDRDRLRVVVSAMADAARRNLPGVPLVIVHGGGKEIDAALKAAGIPKAQAKVRRRRRR